jgi:hypothetical protein
MIFTEAVLLAALTLAGKMLDLIMLIVQDQPKAERVAAWQRWFAFWGPVWKALGLDPARSPLAGDDK